MGGEKLKSSQARWGAVLAFIIIFFSGSLPLYAQSSGTAPSAELSEGTENSAQAAADTPAAEASPAQNPAIDESAILLGETSDAPEQTGVSSVSVLFRMVLLLAVAALAIYGVIFFIKRLARPAESRDPHLKILARVPLTNDTFAAVLSVGSKAWLVGGGSGAVNLIAEIDDIESVETMLLDDAQRISETETRRNFDFRSLLRRFGAQGEGKDSAGGSSHAEALRKQRERLKRL